MEIFEYTSSNGFIELTLSREQCFIGGHTGDCYEDVKQLLEHPSIYRQLDAVDSESFFKELIEEGAWTAADLQDVKENWIKLLWLACSEGVEYFTKIDQQRYEQFIMEEKKKIPVYQLIAMRLNTFSHILHKGDLTKISTAEDALQKISKNLLPHGSGFDAGCKIVYETYEASKPNQKCIFITAPYHHMDDNGMYDGWSDLVIKISPSLQFGFDLTITKCLRKYRETHMEYFYDIFHDALNIKVLGDKY